MPNLISSTPSPGIIIPFKGLSLETDSKDTTIELVDCKEFVWEIESPETYGIDGNILSNILNGADSLDYMYSIIIVKDGKIIGEKYYNGKSIDDYNNIHSVAKSITSALVGIAFDRGYLTDIK